MPTQLGARKTVAIAVILAGVSPFASAIIHFSPSHSTFQEAHDPAGLPQDATRTMRSGQGPPINPHALRHAYATNLAEGGADPIAIKELLGHSDIGTTQIYTHLSTKHLRAVYMLCHPRA
jgi:integrase